MIDNDYKDSLLREMEHFVWRSPYWYMNRGSLIEAVEESDSQFLLGFAIELQRANDLMAEDLRRMYEQSRCFVLSGKVAE